MIFIFFQKIIFSLKKECQKYLTSTIISSQIMAVIHDHAQGLFLTQSMNTK